MTSQEIWDKWSRSSDRFGGLAPNGDPVVEQYTDGRGVLRSVAVDEQGYRRMVGVVTKRETDGVWHYDHNAGEARKQFFAQPGHPRTWGPLHILSDAGVWVPKVGEE